MWISPCRTRSVELVAACTLKCVFRRFRRHVPFPLLCGRLCARERQRMELLHSGHRGPSELRDRHRNMGKGVRSACRRGAVPSLNDRLLVDQRKQRPVKRATPYVMYKMVHDTTRSWRYVMSVSMARTLLLFSVDPCLPRRKSTRLRSSPRPWNEPSRPVCGQTICATRFGKDPAAGSRKCSVTCVTPARRDARRFAPIDSTAACTRKHTFRGVHGQVPFPVLSATRTTSKRIAAPFSMALRSAYRFCLPC
jgi:hypothetical protein